MRKRSATRACRRPELINVSIVTVRFGGGPVGGFSPQFQPGGPPLRFGQQGPPGGFNGPPGGFNGPPGGFNNGPPQFNGPPSGEYKLRGSRPAARTADSLRCGFAGFPPQGPPMGQNGPPGMPPMGMAPPPGKSCLFPLRAIHCSRLIPVVSPSQVSVHHPAWHLQLASSVHQEAPQSVQDPPWPLLVHRNRLVVLQRRLLKEAQKERSWSMA